MRKLEDGNIRRKREVSGQNRRVGISAVENWGKRLKGFHPPKRLRQEQLVQPRCRGSLTLRRDG